jgi:hypothetical protein
MNATVLNRLRHLIGNESALIGNPHLPEDMEPDVARLAVGLRLAHEAAGRLQERMATCERHAEPQAGWDVSCGVCMLEMLLAGLPLALVTLLDTLASATSLNQGEVEKMLVKVRRHVM